MIFSIAIATWNRAELLRRTLESIIAVRVPDDLSLELLVCDNNSTDDTKQIVESFEVRFEKVWGGHFRGRGPVRYLFEPRQGKSYALNRLIAEAGGDWMLFADDDVQVERNWLEAYVAATRRYPDAAVFAGEMLPWLAKPPTLRQRMLMHEYPGVFALLELDGDRPIDPDEGMAAGANMLLRRDAIPPEGFDTKLGPRGRDPLHGEDAKLVRQLIESGREGWLIADATVRHYVHPARLNVRYLWKWNRYVGRKWNFDRGRPQAGRFGVAWWAWREMGRRLARMMLSWRPWASERYLRRVAEAAQYWGYLRGE